jgi:hypothetical protein
MEYKVTYNDGEREHFGSYSVDKKVRRTLLTAAKAHGQAVAPRR